jgi:Ca2+-binding RTX toxin-like protein
MALVVNAPVQEVIGTKVNDDIIDGFAGDSGTVMDTSAPEAIKSNGLEGDDKIVTKDANDLAAGDMFGDEWTFIDGEWVYDESAVVLSDYGMAYSYHDVIVTGQGNDVLLGNGGNDHLDAGAGGDRIIAGRGDDVAFGGTGNDRIYLENGNDVAEGGHGDDVINVGAGDDIVYGDNKDDNLLENLSSNSTTFDGLVEGGAWTMTDKDGQSQISQSASTVAGETYTISFDLAANFGGGHSAGAVQVICFEVRNVPQDIDNN